jgi:GMP synthase (glutamine-hydrolysing)
VLTFGGAMNVEDRATLPWIDDELDALQTLLGSGTPVLGVCLGAQLLAAAAGADVSRAQAPEIGWYDVKLTAVGAGDPVTGGLEPKFSALEWHSYEFALPEGATLLATSDACLQAFRIGTTAYGIQFHAEVTEHGFNAWLDDYRSDPDAIAIGLDPEALRAHTAGRIGDWNELGRGLAERFIELAVRVPRP